MTIIAGGNLSATAGGLIDVAAGNDAGFDAIALANDGTVKFTADAGVSLATKGTMTFTLTGQSFEVLGGADGGVSGEVAASHGGKATDIIDQTVSLTAGGKLKEAGAGNLKLIAGAFPTLGTDVEVLAVPGAAAGATVNSGITIKGSSISVSHAGTFTDTSVTGLDSGGLVEKGTITISGGHITGFAPRPVIGRTWDSSPWASAASAA